ncbi:uncharacterized protein [Dysidea avara]|uniref:uncharacterized protein isoform X2 n=1 Tax=Dysidea avara TaxID=196820 RepID=UPI00332DD938
MTANVASSLVLHHINLTGVEIGRGAYGRVFEVDYEGTLCAAKEVHTLLLQYAQGDELQKIKDDFLRECQIWSTLRHPCIVQFLGVYYPTVEALPVMVMEKMQHSLRSVMERYTNIPMNMKLSILNEVCLGIRYLHSRTPPIVHRDLTPNNILLGDHLKAKITDLGVAKLMMQAPSSRTMTRAPGTTDFMPAESLADRPVYGLPLDVFSFGGVILYTATQLWPQPSSWVQFDSHGRRIAVTEVTRRQHYLDRMIEDAADLKPLVMSCLDDNPKNRPLIEQVSVEIKRAKDVISEKSDLIPIMWWANVQQSSSVNLEVDLPDPSKCEAIIPNAVANKEASLVVTLKNSDCRPILNGAEVVSVSVKTKYNSEVATKAINELDNGIYSVGFIPTVYGDHTIYIQVNGEHIPGSPYKIVVTLRDYSKMKDQNCNQVVTHYTYDGNKFGYLRDVAILPDGEVAIVDNDSKVVILLDKDFKLVRLIGKEHGNGKLTDPCCIAFNNNIIAVSDQEGSHQVKKYSLQGELLSVIGQYGSYVGQFDYPRGLVFDNHGKLYVIDGFNLRIQVFRGNDKFAFSFGSRGSNPAAGQLQFPVRIAIDSNDFILVSDVEKNCILVYTHTGIFINFILCNHPWAIAVTPDGFYLTSHKSTESEKIINVWSPIYQLIAKFGRKGSQQGEFCDIRSIAMDCAGNIFITEGENQRLQVIRNILH